MIAMFGGSFDPITIGHLNVAQTVLKYNGFSKIIFVPCHQNPHKYSKTASDEHRLNMLKLAIEGNPDLEISDYELTINKESRTINTVRYLIEEDGLNLNEDNKLNLIIGEDSVLDFDNWLESDKIKRLCDIIVVKRFMTDEKTKLFSQGKVMYLDNIISSNISSTKFRMDPDTYRYIVPSKVYKYIKDYGLYNNE
jgi:nicotinate-nucleotide adenylyltransferase